MSDDGIDIKARAWGNCSMCGAATDRVTQLEGLVEATVHICESCFERAEVELAWRRRQFELLIANGVDRKRANEIMIARIRVR